jgi:hypothetical protein
MPVRGAGPAPSVLLSFMHERRNGHIASRHAKWSYIAERKRERMHLPMKEGMLAVWAREAIYPFAAATPSSRPWPGRAPAR